MSAETKLILTPALSPSKLSLLSLIAAYCAVLLPSRQNPPLLATIVEFINLVSSKDQQDNGDSNRVIILPTLDDLLLHLSNAIKQHSIYKLKLSKDLILKDIELIESVLLNSLWSIENLDDLHEFITKSKSLLIEDNSRNRKKLYLSSNKNSKILTKSSFLGKFVNNIIISFEYLEFDKTMYLWKSFKEYRLNCNKNFTERILESQSYDNKIEKLILSTLPNQQYKPDLLIISQIDLSNLLDYQIHLLEAYGTPTPPNLTKILSLMTQLESGTLPSIYYIKYLECLKNGDYEASFENLHRYFDYMMSNKQKILYHYALLSLATLHASFGSDEEAIRSIEEAILVARENKDLNCLNYLLTWVFNFIKDKPHLSLANSTNTDNSSNSMDFEGDYSDNIKILNFLKIKTKEHKNYQLQSIYYQFKAFQQIVDGDDLNKILENLLLSNYLSLNYGNMSISNNESDEFLTTFIKNCQLQSSLWLRLGELPLSEVYLDIALDLCSLKHNIFEEVSIMIRKSYLEFYKKNYEKSFKIINSLESKVLNNNNALFKIWESRRLVLIIRYYLITDNDRKNFVNCNLILNKLKRQVEDLNDLELKMEVQSLEKMSDRLGS
ncbi:hypothetical protein PACTADRAFT_47967 [Pachysolen tannophilus NRRL Y-2460]|uniref:Anaphase-promoting complex subunit 5 n=1 Tax=Pachysolen tannophilus NRRL Y-2460 TaxID=669874 RepID=A0A1E4U2E0_PACTA|nr:hypothetical protein PACTADRAFT_47967 [Pachysolen tannophilus NRRL Y-2460]